MLPEINRKETTILIPSNYNYTNDLVNMINKGYEIITKHNPIDIQNIPLKLMDDFDCMKLNLKKDLTKQDEMKLIILESISSSKETIVLCNILTYLDTPFKEKVINYLKEKNKTIINITTDVEETILLNYLMVIYNNKVVLEGNTMDILTYEKILKKLGYKLPFIVELSSGLKYYGLVDKIYLDKESLVNDLWK